LATEWQCSGCGACQEIGNGVDNGVLYHKLQLSDECVPYQMLQVMDVWVILMVRAEATELAIITLESMHRV